MAFKITITRGETNESQWLSVADVMSGLMMIFLLLSIAFIQRAVEISEGVQDYEFTIEEIAEKLRTEFHKDLKDWGAQFVAKDLEFQFLNERVMFDTGESTVKPEFEEILSDFFPRYLKVLEQYRSDIREIRIEGHTSSRWGSSSENEAYFNNMKLSQDRTRSVLNYVYNIPVILENYAKWVRSDVVAVGMSSAKVVYVNGAENAQLSRRVTFRIITNSEEKILCRSGYACEDETIIEKAGQPSAEIDFRASPSSISVIEKSGEKQLSIVFSGQSWIEIRDSEDQIVLADLFNARDHLSLTITEPVEVLVGSVTNTSISVDGQKINLANKAYEDVARVVLGL